MKVQVQESQHEAKDKKKNTAFKQTIIYASKSEKQCALLMQKFLSWEPVLFRTYQRPITETHSADFYIPERNAVVEWHPPVLRWYMFSGGFERTKRLESHMSGREKAELQDILCQQITHDYFKRRRALMDMSQIDGVKQMRLIVCADWSDFYQLVIKPFSKEQLNFETFKNYLEQVK